MEADSCWPIHPCPEKTKCRPLQSKGHVCLKYGLLNMLNETFRGNISSPGFPISYNNGMHETWTIEVCIGNIVALRFTYFDLEHCCDYVTVYDGVSKDKLLVRLSGASVPLEIRSTRNCIVIIMTTDSSSIRVGFSADVYEIVL